MPLVHAENNYEYNFKKHRAIYEYHFKGQNLDNIYSIAQEHLNTLREFNQYPQRNYVQKRANTKKEEEWLKKNNYSWAN